MTDDRLATLNLQPLRIEFGIPGTMRTLLLPLEVHDEVRKMGPTVLVSRGQEGYSQSVADQLYNAAFRFEMAADGRADFTLDETVEKLDHALMAMRLHVEHAERVAARKRPPADSPRSIRVNKSVWDGAGQRIAALDEPVTVTLTVHPGDTRNAVVEQFLRALIEETD